MSAEMHRVEVEVDDHCYAALQSQAERLGVDVNDVVQRAMSAWLSDICDNDATPNVTMQQ